MAMNQNIDTQLCTHMKNHHHNMNYFEMDYSIFFHLNLFQVNAICKKWPYKSYGLFFPFFETPTLNRPHFVYSDLGS
jgi:hypothetical protein